MLNNAFAVGLRTLAANPLRTFLSTLGVIIGTAALVAVLAVGDGVEQFAREQIATSTDLQLFSISPVLSRHLDGLTLPRADTVALGPDDLTTLRTAVGEGIRVGLSRSGGSLIGGIAPVTGRHSVIERPESVSRVAPPTITMAAISPHMIKSQRAMRLAAAGDAAPGFCAGGDMLIEAMGLFTAIAPAMGRDPASRLKENEERCPRASKSWSVLRSFCRR